MTGPVRPLVLSLDGRSARELYAIERTNDNGEPTNPPAGAGGVLIPDLTIADGGGMTVMSAQPAAETDYWPRSPWYDSTGANQMRVVVDDVEVAGATTARIIAKQKDTSGGTFANPGIGVTEVAAAINAVGQAKSSWIDIDPSGIGERLWHAYAVGGNASLTPVVGGIHIQFRQTTVARPPIGGPPGSDLPEDATWGAIVEDANAAHAAMVAAYGNGDDVTAFFDRIAANDFVTAPGFGLPTYQATGFNGSRPCVQWSGGNIPLNAPANPTQSLGDWTWYLVIENLGAGADGAFVFGDPGNGSFSMRINADNTHIGATVNTPGGGLALVSDTWGMSGAHIYRFVKDSTALKFYVFVDGVKVLEGGSSSGAPNDTPSLTLMNYVSGLGITGRVGRVVGYNMKHTSSTNSGPTADGLTAPEAVLKAFWGTP